MYTAVLRFTYFLFLLVPPQIVYESLFSDEGDAAEARVSATQQTARAASIRLALCLPAGRAAASF